jgi:hypothetical protein
MGLSETCAQNLPSNKGKFNPTFYPNKWLASDLYRSLASRRRGGPLEVGMSGSLQQNPHAVVAGLLLAASLGVRFRGFDPALLNLALVVNHLFSLPFFNGPWNGGADRISLLEVLCLTCNST